VSRHQPGFPPLGITSGCGLVRRRTRFGVDTRRDRRALGAHSRRVSGPLRVTLTAAVASGISGSVRQGRSLGGLAVAGGASTPEDALLGWSQPASSRRSPCPALTVHGGREPRSRNCSSTAPALAGPAGRSTLRPFARSWRGKTFSISTRWTSGSASAQPSPNGQANQVGCLASVESTTPLVAMRRVPANPPDGPQDNVEVAAGKGAHRRLVTSTSPGSGATAGVDLGGRADSSIASNQRATKMRFFGSSRTSRPESDPDETTGPLLLERSQSRLPTSPAACSAARPVDSRCRSARP